MKLHSVNSLSYFEPEMQILIVTLIFISHYLYYLNGISVSLCVITAVKFLICICFGI